MNHLVDIFQQERRSVVGPGISTIKTVLERGVWVLGFHLDLELPVVISADTASKIIHKIIRYKFLLLPGVLYKVMQNVHINSIGIFPMTNYKHVLYSPRHHVGRIET